MIKSTVVQVVEMFLKERDIINLHTEAHDIAEDIVNLLVSKHIIRPIHVVTKDDISQIMNGWKPEGKK